MERKTRIFSETVSPLGLDILKKQQQEKEKKIKDKNWIQRLFCKHEYRVCGAVFASTGVDLHTCIKCGKVKNI